MSWQHRTWSQAQHLIWRPSARRCVPANAAAAASTTAVVVAAGDEVSAAIAALFGSYGQQYQAISTQAAGFHAQFAQLLSGAGGAYASAEAANGAPLQALQEGVLGVINAPANAVLGRPLIGNGANGLSGTGQNGGDGGILFGNGVTAGPVHPVRPAVGAAMRA